MAEEITLESLARRVEKLERLLLQQETAPRNKDWRRVVGIVGDSEFMRQVDEAGQAIRRADREAVDQCFVVEQHEPAGANQMGRSGE